MQLIATEVNKISLQVAWHGWHAEHCEKAIMHQMAPTSSFAVQKIGLLFAGLSAIFVSMEIDVNMVDKLAHLARLRFDDADKKAISEDLQKMVAFVEKLKELDTTGVEPLLHIGDAVNVLREDEVRGSVSREEALRNSPVADDTFFKVPKVIRK
jgi:aspartyl-tRNA(Asn)/glutamyl-tRNA(Gln) amidotransferase subunit C